MKKDKNAVSSKTQTGRKNNQIDDLLSRDYITYRRIYSPVAHRNIMNINVYRSFTSRLLKAAFFLFFILFW